LSRASSARRAAAISAAIAAAVGVWAARRRLADRTTDRLFRQPHGPIARSFYREARPHQEAFRETLAALALGPADHLLEVGCGGGTFLEWALAAGCNAVAIDHSAEMLALAEVRNASAITDGRLELRQGDAANLPFPDGQFTAAATINAFFFFDAPEATLAEIYRTLAPAGRIAIHTTDTAPPPVARRMHLYTDDELTRMLTEAGYAEISLRRTGPRRRSQLVIARKPASGAPRPSSDRGEANP
jgi:SAM-dependent methyltransferase